MNFFNENLDYLEHFLYLKQIDSAYENRRKKIEKLSIKKKFCVWVNKKKE